MIDLSTLNTEQRHAATHIDGPLMILAGAGTGKTRVITYRIAYMLGCGIFPEQIVALSFTNKAAKEMAERVKTLIGAKSKKVWLGTFHSFCLHLLRAHSHALGLPANFGLADTADQIELVRRSLEEKGWSGLYKVDQIHQQISRAKNYLLTPEQILAEGAKGPFQGDPAVLAEVFKLYERQLKLHRVIDFDDCIYKTVFLLSQNPEIRESCHRKFKYFMVDEFQDTNLAQLKVLELMVPPAHNVCVVGDDDQSIYSWRGAMYEILENFEQLFPGTKISKLEQNYRCTNVILDAANKVIKNNKRRKDKTLWSASKDQIPITIHLCTDDGEEAKYVADKCLALLGSGFEPRDIAILYRANAQARAFELILRESRISTKTYGGQSFFERKEIKDFLCYLRLVLNPHDRLALWRIINTPHRGIGLKTLERIDGIAHADKKSPYEVLEDFDHSGVKEFISLMNQLKSFPKETPDQFLSLGQQIIKLSGLDTEIKLKNDNLAARDRKLQNLRGMPPWIESMAKHLFNENGSISHRNLLDILSLDGDRFEGDEKGKGNHISLMTIHAAKGLEYPAVFVVGLEEDYLPHKNSLLDAASICEERRLFYVALTRAKSRLFLSHCQERLSGYQGKIARFPSRFIKEIPESAYIATNAGTEAPAQDDRKQTFSRKLSQLRNSIAAPNNGQSPRKPAL